MGRNVPPEYKQRVAVFKALSHPTRLFVVDELSKHGELCVCELTEMVGADMSTVSRHLSQLRQVGIVEDEKRGTSVYYKLCMPCLSEMFDCMDGSCGKTKAGTCTVLEQ